MRISDVQTKSPWLSFIGLLFASFFVIEAMAFQITVVPVVTGEFGIAIALSGLISLFYYLAHTVFGPIFGNIGDQIGRKKIVLLGFMIFGIAEFMAAFSPSFIFFLIARFIQGIGAASIIPAAISYATILFPPEKRGTALGVYTSVSALGAAAGGLLGGLLIGNFGWQSVYIFTGLASVLSFFIVMFILPETERKERKPFDYVGSLYLLIGVGALLSVTILVSEFGIDSPYTIAAFLFGLGVLTLFWFYESKTKNAFMDVSFFKIPKFILPVLVMLLTAVCFQGIIYTNSFYITSKPGGGSELAGFVTMFIYLSSAVGGLIGGKLIDIYKVKSVILACLSGFLIGVIMFYQFDVHSTTWYITTTIGIMAGTQAMLAAGTIKMSMGIIPKSKLGQASGTFVMLRDLGNPIGQTTGLALFGAISSSSLAAALTNQAQNAGVNGNFMSSVQKAGEVAGNTIDPALANHLNQLGLKFIDLFRAAELDGMIMALNRMSIIVLIITAGILILGLFLPNTPKDKEKKLTKEKKIEETEIV